MISEEGAALEVIRTNTSLGMSEHPSAPHVVKATTPPVSQGKQSVRMCI